MTRMRYLPGAVFAALLAFVAVFAGSDPAHAGTFDPTLEVTIVDTTPETPSDIQVDFGLPTESVQFAGVIQFIPSDWGIVRGDADSLPIGTDVGYLDSEATLGLVNAACQQVLPVHFDFKNSSIDITDTISFLDDDSNGTADFAEDKDANGDYDSVDKYPSFLNSLFDGQQPIRRSSGVTLVAGIPVLLQFLIFAPGTEINENIPHEADLGFPSVTVLQNIGDPDAVPSPSPITDFCAPLITQNITLGVAEGGTQLWVNPKPGKYTFNTIAVGQRDADDDGFENSLDTCVLDPNEGSPKIAGGGDIDSDGLDEACDPDPETTNSDEDADGYLNRQDNCPLEPNGQPFDEANPGEDETNQADEDLDQIGDVCDPDPAVANGELHGLDAEPLSVEVTIGDGTGEGGPPSEQACPDCFRGTVDGPDDDGGSSSGVLIGVIVAVIAAIVIIGGGAALMMRRRNAA